MPLLIVVAVLIVVGVVWRARVTRRLTIEESVDRYRRTLSAVHDATIRSREGESETAPAQPYAQPFAPRSGRALGPPSRRVVAGAVAAAIALVVVAVVATHRGGGRPRALSATTTRPRAARTTTTTTIAAPTTTVPLVRFADATGTAFTVGRSSYTLVFQSNNGACWIDARDPGGASLFTGVLTGGASQTITVASPTATVRLGNPGAVTLTVDGAPVPFVTHNGAPVTLHFQGTTA